MLRGAELGLLPGERTAADVHDERVVGEHVAPAGARGAQAQVVLLAVAQAERQVEDADRVDQRAADEQAEADAGRQVGIGRHGRRGERRAHRLRIARRRGHGLFSQKRGNEQISALFENGVIVPMRGSVAAQRSSASSQPRGDDRVRVEQHDVGARQLHAAVGRPGEAEVALVAQQRRPAERAPLEFGEVRGDRRDRATRRRSAPAARRDAGARARSRRSAHVVRRVVHRHHDVDET